MDAIFEHKNFLNEIIWQYDGPQRPSKRCFRTKHDTIFRYAKTKDYYSDPDFIAPFQQLKTDELSDPQYKRLSDGRYYYTTPRGDYTDTSIERLSIEDRIEYTKNGKVRIRHFLPVDNDGNFGRKKQLPDVWTDIISLGHAGGKERYGYPTQKPLALYERIINTSSSKGDIVLDPFAGCATTLIAAERLERQWVGIDIWDNAIQAVKDRLSQEFMSTESDNEKLALYPVHYSKDIPERTDDGEETVPFLRVKQKAHEPAGPRWSRDEMYEHLLEQNGPICQGCKRKFDDKRYLELDHNTPRSDGGINHISNRILLCGPCNKLKSNRFTLSGLIRENKNKGYWRG